VKFVRPLTQFVYYEGQLDRFWPRAQDGHNSAKLRQLYTLQRMLDLSTAFLQGPEARVTTTIFSQLVAH
jgi:hypothetical protein